MSLNPRERDEARARLRKMSGGTYFGGFPSATLDEIIDSAIGDLIEDRQRMCDGSCDIALARRQVGPDGYVPGSAKECAEMWEREASRLRAELRALGGKP